MVPGDFSLEPKTTYLKLKYAPPRSFAWICKTFTKNYKAPRRQAESSI